MGRRNGSEGKWFVTRVYPAYPNRTQERELLRQLMSPGACTTISPRPASTA